MEITENEIRVGSGEDLLLKAVKHVLLGTNGYRSVQGLVRVVVPVDDVRLLPWLRAQVGAPKFYWRGRASGSPAVACFGAADVFAGSGPEDLKLLEDRRRNLLGPDARDVRYYGGCAFDAAVGNSSTRVRGAVEGDDDARQDFSPIFFFLPRFELHEAHDGTRLICNLLLPRDRNQGAEILEAVGALKMEYDTVFDALPVPESRVNVPAKEAWLAAVRQTTALLEEDVLAKVVLARKATFTFEEPVDACALLDRLEPVTPGCFHFLAEMQPDVQFIGASPERLFERRGREIRSEAVAGTRPRGASADDDQRLRDELLLSEKDRREHEYVEQSIREVLDPLCDRLQVDADASAMTLTRGRHLYSGIEGRLKSAVSDVDLLRSLHPTPAVGGYPTGEALEAIRRIEPFDRGWYAGPIGWMSDEESEFAVAIRTGLVKNRTLTLYSGAGIVSGSEPQAEWDEIEHKIGDFTDVLGLDLERAKY